jgi:hypothetical protein
MPDGAHPVNPRLRPRLSPSKKGFKDSLKFHLITGTVPNAILDTAA